jgi:hypothetical protein
MNSDQAGTLVRRLPITYTTHLLDSNSIKTLQKPGVNPERIKSCLKIRHTTKYPLDA